MLIKTNLSWNTLARYSAMVWNNGEDEYTMNGDNFVECVEAEEDPDFVLTVDWLKSDCEWHIEKQRTMLDEDFIADYHRDYLEGYRDEETVAGHKEYLKQRNRINAFKRQFKTWLASVEVIDTWTFDTDKDEFISFPASANGRAVPNLYILKGGSSHG